MEKPIRSNITIKASSIHECNSANECSAIHEHTTTPPRIFRPLFQTKDSPSLGRRSSGLMSLIVIILLTILVSIASSNNTFATTSTLSLSVNDIVSLNLGNASNGVLVGSTSTTDTTISVNTTNATGYTLKIAASSGTSGTPVPLSNVDTGCTTNCIIPSITTATSTNDVSSLTTGTWGYFPSKFNSTANTVYRPAPTVEGDILDVTNAANASSNSSDNNNYNITIGAKLDYANTTPGTYSSAFIVTAIANATPYTITYNANGGSNGPANENASTYASTVNISSTVPTKTNYTFLGWCAGTSSSSNITTTAGVDSCSATVYNPNGGGTNLSLAIDQTASSNDNYLYAMWMPNTYSLAITFAGTGVSSVKVCKVSGNCSGTNLIGTISSSGNSVSGLAYGTAYYLYPSFSSGYTLSSWAKTDSATGSSLSSTSATNPTYTVGTGNGAVTITGKTATYSLTITFAGTGVSSVQIRTASGTGGTLKGTVSSSGGSVSGLTYNTTYYLLPVFSSGYELDNWKKTSSAGALAGVTTTNTTTTTTNPTFKMGAGNGAVTITGKSSCTTTTFSGYMQDISASTISGACNGDSGTLTDKRDSKTYTVKKINGQLWMTQNLRYLGDTGSTAGTMTIGNGNSNVANTSITLYSLNSSNAGSFNAYSGHCNSTNGYNYACVYDSGSTSTGVWYNFYAASAGTISGSPNSTATTSDICPAGWHLPSGPNTTANTDYNKLFGNTTSGWQAATSGLTAFSAVAGGYYSGSGFLDSPRIGYWWSATANGTGTRRSLVYDSGDEFTGSDYNSRYHGLFVRCVRSS